MNAQHNRCQPGAKLQLRGYDGVMEPYRDLPRAPAPPRLLPALLDLLYREHCRDRLASLRATRSPAVLSIAFALRRHVAERCGSRPSSMNCRGGLPLGQQAENLVGTGIGEINEDQVSLPQVPASLRGSSFAIKCRAEGGERARLLSAVGLAPRARMDEPGRNRLRSASSAGLTSPNPVTAPRRP